MSSTARKLAPRAAATGRERPRLSPPLPLRHEAPAVLAEADRLGLSLYPWQRRALRYPTATVPGGGVLYPEVAIIVARQNGKTTISEPLVVRWLRLGLRVMHVAHTRELPREMFDLIATALSDEPELFPRRRGRIIWPRYGAGQEEIKLNNGGRYRIAAARTGGARGFPNDRVIVDELREMYSHDFMGALLPTLVASPDPQVVYLSNAGTDESVVLNAIRDRAGSDPALAYLEWSAAPQRQTADRDGWLEANPSAGHRPGLWRNLERAYESARLGGTLGQFETENLCRWVHTILPPIVRIEGWQELHADSPPPRRPVLGLALDPAGRRASAALAWQRDDGRVATRLVADELGEPVDVPAFGEALRRLAKEQRVRRVAYDAATDQELAKYVTKPESVSGAKMTNASSMFVTLVEGRNLTWDGEPVTADIEWTGRRTHAAPGTWTAVPLSDEHPVTGMLATIRAVWLASGPRPVKARVM